MISAATTTETTSSTLRRMVHLRLVVLREVALGLLVTEVAGHVVLALSNLVRGTPTLVVGVGAGRVAGGITTVVLVSVPRRSVHLGGIVVHPLITALVVATRHLTTHVVKIGGRLLPPAVVVVLGLGRRSLASTLLMRLLL